MLATSLLLAAVFSAPAQAYSSLFVFGDSLSDPGNNAAFIGSGSVPADITSNIAVPHVPYASGTYSNGKVWAQTVAAALGVPGGAAFGPLGGTNFAFGGAETSREDVIPGFSDKPPSLRTQAEGFLKFYVSAPSDALYVVEGGANNLRRVAVSLAGATPTDFNAAVAVEAATYAADIGYIVDKLQGAGAKNIIVWNAPNAGLTPASLAFGPAVSFASSSIATAFNTALAARLSTEPITVKTFDVFGLYSSITADPAAFGFNNITDACGNPNLDCSKDIGHALFWDGIHPTSAGHALLAQRMLALAVPETSTYAMFLVGLIGCGWAARRRHN
jgi:outer membrane lipase/esterase